MIVGFSTISTAQEHDHQSWNMVEVGRLVSIARVDKHRGRTAYEQTADATQEAVNRLQRVMDSFECRTMVGKTAPSISTFAPLTKYDHGPIVLAEMGDLSCSLSPTRQLFPADREEFKELCSQLHWKCDVVWISDGDPTVWHINRWQDIPKHTP